MSLTESVLSDSLWMDAFPSATLATGFPTFIDFPHHFVVHLPPKIVLVSNLDQNMTKSVCGEKTKTTTMATVVPN